MTPEFEKIVREIWQQHRSRTILTEALGPDPVLFAESIIEAWEGLRMTSSDPSQTRIVSYDKTVNLLQNG